MLIEPPSHSPQRIVGSTESDLTSAAHGRRPGPSDRPGDTAEVAGAPRSLEVRPTA